MILSDKTLKKMIESGELGIEPVSPESIQPASVDCRLGDHYLIVDDSHMDSLTMDSEIKYREIIGDSITIPPKSFLLFLLPIDTEQGSGS